MGRLSQNLKPWGATPAETFARTAIISLIAGLALLGVSLNKIEHLPLSEAPLHFDGSRAHEFMTRLAKDYPNRLPWHPNHEKARDWIKSQFRAMGYEPRTMGFSSTIVGKTYTNLENIYAEKRGAKHPDQIIVVMGHYDTTDTTVEGAMDNASGVGIVLELARIFAKETPDRTILFLADDCEEFGAMWGARAFARQFDRRNQIVAAASFDFVAPEKQVRILQLTDGLQKGYTPLWLRELGLDALRSVGRFQTLDFANVVEFASRAILIPASDHGVLLANGIPAFNWIGQMDNFSRQMSFYHHTPEDRAEIMQPQSFQDMGEAAERLVRSIDTLAQIPADYRSSAYFKISDRLYIDGWVSHLLHVLAFVPFLAYCISRFRRVWKNVARPEVIDGFQHEAKRWAITFLGCLVGYLTLRLLPALRVIDQYEFFPATQKSLILYHPSYPAILLVVAISILTYYAARWAVRSPLDREPLSQRIEIRHAFHGALIALVIAIALVGNSYLAALLLIPPAYLWAFLTTRQTPGARWVNLALLGGGTITLVVMSIIMTTIFHVGSPIWYLFLSASYGLVDAFTAVMFLAAISTLIRLFRIFVLSARLW